MEIQGLSFGVNPVNKKENIFGDDIGFVEHYDFSQANMSEKHRIHAISAVASICYQSPKSIGSESLYNRLMSESKGLPSSSFEFVPVLLDRKNSKHKEILDLEFSNCKKYGEDLDNRYLLTNYRALVYDYENHVFSFDIREIYNTEKEIKNFGFCNDKKIRDKNLGLIFLKRMMF
jgi:thymidylate synthase (FAD)